MHKIRADAPGLSQVKAWGIGQVIQRKGSDPAACITAQNDPGAITDQLINQSGAQQAGGSSAAMPAGPARPAIPRSSGQAPANWDNRHAPPG